VAKFYAKNPSLDYFPTALDRTKVYFDAMTQGQEVTKRIDAIYRFKGTKEFIFYAQDLRSANQMGNSHGTGPL
jgi:hypothetical protein